MTNTSDVIRGKDTSGNNTAGMSNSTATVFPVHHMQKIFLQTSAAQGISGAFAFAALILTCWQVNIAGHLTYICSVLYYEEGSSTYNAVPGMKEGPLVRVE